MMAHLLKTLLVMLFFLVTSAQADEPQKTPSPEGARLYIISPANGETVNKTVTVKFGLQGMGVSPAGLNKAATGHHHLIIDGEKLPDLNKPMSSEVIHFGGGQTETTIELAEGRHTLQLILGDHRHIPHNPPVISETITIFVK